MIITLTVQYDTDNPGTLEEALREFLKLRSDQPQSTPEKHDDEADEQASKRE